MVLAALAQIMIVPGRFWLAFLMGGGLLFAFPFPTQAIETEPGSRALALIAEGRTLLAPRVAGTCIYSPCLREAQAERKFRAAVELAPDQAEAWFGWGESLIDLGACRETLPLASWRVRHGMEAESDWNSKSNQAARQRYREAAAEKYRRGIALRLANQESLRKSGRAPFLFEFELARLAVSLNKRWGGRIGVGASTKAIISAPTYFSSAAPGQWEARQAAEQLILLPLINDSAEQEALYRKVENQLQAALAKAPDPAPVWDQWGQSLLELAVSERDITRFEAHLAQALASIDHGVETESNRSFPQTQIYRLHWGRLLADAAQGLNEEKAHRLLAAADDQMARAEALGAFADGYEYYERALILYRWSELEPGGAMAGEYSASWRHYQAAVEQMKKCVETNRRTYRWSPAIHPHYPWPGLFELAELYNALARRRVGGSWWPLALETYRSAFDQALAEIDRPGFWLGEPIRDYSTTSWNENSETFSSLILGDLVELWTAELLASNPPEKLLPLEQAQLAGLLRYPAAMGLLPHAEREAWWAGAEELLSQAMAAWLIELEPKELTIWPRPAPAASRRFADQLPSDLHTPSFILAELGLILAERAVLTKPTYQADLLAEAETRWAEAEELRTGSSRYARARLAAWREDADAVRRLVAHSPEDTRRGLFPIFKEARSDPAFADIKDAAWFKRAWYGLER